MSLLVLNYIQGENNYLEGWFQKLMCLKVPSVVQCLVAMVTKLCFGHKHLGGLNISGEGKTCPYS